MHLPLDYTFCSGLRCERRTQCARWTGLFRDVPRSLLGKKISVAQFGDHNGECEEFISIKPKKTKKQK